MTIVDLSRLNITSPKLQQKDREGWKGFYPYYAGFSLSFVENVLSTSDLPANSVLLDPWNGSGTTTFAAGRYGFRSYGIDLNPAMLVVARARSLRAIDVDSIEPLLNEVENHFKTSRRAVVDSADPLLARFEPNTVVEGVGALRANNNTYGEGVEPILRCCDTAGQWKLGEGADLAISSPPYCTRLDYAAATELELAISYPLSGDTLDGLRRKMLGTCYLRQMRKKYSRTGANAASDFSVR
jgi:SAM-dependent methyltransferase